VRRGRQAGTQTGRRADSSENHPRELGRDVLGQLQPPAGQTREAVEEHRADHHGAGQVERHAGPQLAVLPRPIQDGAHLLHPRVQEVLARVLPRGRIAGYGFVADWFADSRRFIFAASEQGRQVQMYVQDIQGGDPRAISGAENLNFMRGARCLSPDQRYLAAIDTRDKKIRIVPLEGGSPRPLPGTEPDELPAGWTADGRSVYIYRADTEAPTRVHLVDVASGHRKLWAEIASADQAGTLGIEGLAVNPDGKSYAYNLVRILSDLYLMEGLK